MSGRRRSRRLFRIRPFDEPEPIVEPFDVRFDAVSRRAGLVLDDRTTLAEHAIEERGLADVRPADDDDAGKRGGGVMAQVCHQRDVIGSIGSALKSCGHRDVTGYAVGARSGPCQVTAP